jgi:hypothetical protein
MLANCLPPKPLFPSAFPTAKHRSFLDPVQGRDPESHLIRDAIAPSADALHSRFAHRRTKMKKLDLKHHIRLTISENADPKHPVVLTKDSTDKLADVPKLLRAMAACYGTTLGEPMLWGGAIYLSIFADADLFEIVGTMASDLKMTAIEIHENARQQPPRALTQAVTRPHCIELVRSLSKTFEKSKLTAELHSDDRVFELPHVAMADFTEPGPSAAGQKYVRAKVIGLCVPTDDANVILLGDMTTIEMSRVDYPLATDEVFTRIIGGDAVFVGAADLVRKDVYRAVPGGQLTSQPKLL